MSKNQFLSNILWLILVNLFIKAIFIFGIDLQVQHRTGPSEYGLYFTLLNLCYIFQVLNDFGLNLLHNTDTAMHNKVRVERYYQILRLKIVLALFYSLIVAITAIILGYADHWRLLIWLVINNILVSLILVFRAGISGMGQYRKESIVSVLDKALMIIICGTLLLTLSRFKIEWFAIAQTAALIITAVVAWLLSRKHIDSSPASASLTPMAVVFRDTLPFTLATLLMFVYTRSDSILIEQLLPDGTFHVGIYAAGYRLLDAANTIAYLFSPLLIPMYARLREQKSETRQLIRIAGGMMICLTMTISFAGFWWSEPIMMALYPMAEPIWVQTFQWLILSHIPIGLMYIFGSYLTAVHELKKQNILFVTSVIINVGLNLLIIPRYGTLGAAMVAVITQSLTALGLMILGSRHLNEKVNWQMIGKILLYVVILIAAGYLVSGLRWTWVIEAVIFAGISAAAGFMLKVMDAAEFLKVVKLNALK